MLLALSALPVSPGSNIIARSPIVLVPESVRDIFRYVLTWRSVAALVVMESKLRTPPILSLPPETSKVLPAKFKTECGWIFTVPAAET